MTYTAFPVVELLTPAEEIELARCMEAGALAAEALVGRRDCPGAIRAELDQLVQEGNAARERFMLANLRLVLMVSGRAARQSGLHPGDLFQEGVTGLIQAVDRFDHIHTVRFASYALPWIRSAVARAVANRFGALNLSGARAERRRHVRATWRRLTQQLGRDATAAEVAAALGQSLEGVAELLDLEPPCALVNDAGYVIDPPDVQATAALDQVVETRLPLGDWVRRLPALERRVVELRYGFGREPVTYQGIGAQLGLSPSTVRRIERRALEELRGRCSTGDYAMAG